MPLDVGQKTKQHIMLIFVHLAAGLYSTIVCPDANFIKMLLGDFGSGIHLVLDQIGVTA